MLLKVKRSGYRQAEQFVTGDYLVLFHNTRESSKTLFAAIRNCAMRQMAHWMMGHLRIGSSVVIVSGSCGADGLPLSLNKVKECDRWRLIEVPESVASIYWADKGHNEVNAPARDALKQWALIHYERLRGYQLVSGKYGDSWRLAKPPKR